MGEVKSGGLDLTRLTVYYQANFVLVFVLAIYRNVNKMNH